VSSLNGLVSAARRYSKPFLGVTEVREVEQPPKFSVETRVERLNESFWLIPYVYLKHEPDGYSKLMAYKLFLFFNASPSRIFVEAYGEVSENLSSLGLRYEPETNALVLEPWLLVNSTGNLLVDWRGNPVRIILEVDGEVAVDAQVDAAPVLTNVNVDVYSRYVDTVNQPTIVTQKAKYEPLPPPPPESEGGWMRIFLEALQRLEVQVLIFVLATLLGIAVGLIYFKRKRGKKILVVKAEAHAQKTDAEELLEKIKRLEETGEKQGQ